MDDLHPQIVVLNISDGMGLGLGQTGPQTWFVGVSYVDLLTHRPLFLKVISSCSFIDQSNNPIELLEDQNVYSSQYTLLLYIYIYVYINIYIYIHDSYTFV